MESAAGDCVHAITEMIDLGADMMWRYLTDRDDLSASAALVVNRLNREGPMRLTTLAAAEGASQSGMTQLVQRMERQGLLERWSDPDDGRASLVMLGDAGTQKWDARAELRRQRVATMLSSVPEDDQVALWLAARVMIRAFGQMRDAADSSAEAAVD